MTIVCIAYAFKVTAYCVTFMFNFACMQTRVSKLQTIKHDVFAYLVHVPVRWRQYNLPTCLPLQLGNHHQDNHSRLIISRIGQHEYVRLFVTYQVVGVSQ
jgi:hypothetical protein